MADTYRWPDGGPSRLRNGLTPREVVEALDAPASLRLDNRAPARAPTYLAVCAPTNELRLIVIVCVRAEQHRSWTIMGGSRRQLCRTADVEEAHVMTKKPRGAAGGTPADPVEFVLENDLGEMFHNAEVVRERRPAKMVTAVRLDLDTQAELEALASARGIGSSTLMRQIIEEWVAAHRDAPPPDRISELVRHLDAARRAAASLAQDSAA